MDILKTLIPEITDAEAEIYLDMAKHAILARRYPFGYTESTELEFQYKYLQINIAVELYNRKGTEGQIRHSEGDYDRTYENGVISESLLSQVVPKVKVGY